MNRTSFRLTRTLDRTLLMVAVLTVLAAAFSQTTRPTYVFQRQFDTSSLDPLAIDSPWTQSPIENLYEGLYGYAGATTEVAPLLATAHQLSEDGRVHTFSLRQGVTFHSGNPFTCQDVAYSFRRAMIMAPGIVAQSVLGDAAAALHVSTAVRTDTEYADAWQRLTDGVRCADAHTLIVTSMAPDPILFAALMSPEFFVVDSELAAANADWDGTAATWRSFIGADPHAGYLHDDASGTGAFRLVSWQPGTSLVAERNPDYWGDSPHLQTVVYLVVEDETARVTALLAGEADQIDIRMTPVTALQDEPGVTVLDPAQDPSLPGGVRVVGAIFLNQNMGADDNELLGSGRLDGAGVPPDFFADADVRKCFAYAWDTGEDDPQYADDGTFYPHMLLHPMYSAYDDSVPHYKYDLGKAEEHCRAAWGGRLWENGMYPGGAQHRLDRRYLQGHAGGPEPQVHHRLGGAEPGTHQPHVGRDAGAVDHRSRRRDLPRRLRVHGGVVPVVYFRNRSLRLRERGDRPPPRASTHRTRQLRTRCALPPGRSVGLRRRSVRTATQLPLRDRHRRRRHRRLPEPLQRLDKPLLQI